MNAYHGSQELKRSIIAELEAHRAADKLVKGQYWENGKGCAVGCTIKSSDHALYEPKFGIPQDLARLEDAIFEGLPNELAQQWPVRFMSAINVGSDLSLVQWKALGWIVKRVNPSPSAVVQRVIDGLELRAHGLPWPDADAAYYAAYAVSAAAAADYAADAAAAAAAADYANAAAYADAAYAAYAAAAREVFWQDLSDELVRLLGECK